MVILDIKKPKKCIWYEDGQDCKCPLLDDNDCCRGQGNEANSAANDWDDLMKGCPIKWELVRCEDCKHHEVFKNGVNGWCNEHERPTDVTYFCADGERRTDEQQT